MKDTPLGTRIVEIHNGSSLFHRQGRRRRKQPPPLYHRERPSQAIIALPEKMFYNTGIGTYVWIVTNRKAPNRRGQSSAHKCH